MELWEFEPWLCAALLAHSDVASARTAAEADLPWLYGPEVVSVHGVTVFLRLVRGSDKPRRGGTPDVHAANVARVEGREAPPVKVLPERTALAVEGLVRASIDRAGHPDVVLATPFREARSGSATQGVKVVFTGGAEVFVRLSA